MRALFVLLCFQMLQTSFTFGQTVTLPQTPAGRHVQAYFKAFNSDDEAQMREFFSAYTSQEALKQVGVEQRIDRWRQMHERLRDLKLQKVLEFRDDFISVLVKSQDGGLHKLDFDFEKSAPFGLLRIAIMDIEQPEQSEFISESKKNNADLVSAVTILADSLSKEDRFSGVVLIAHKSTILFHKAYGFANREKKIPNNPETKFNLGSINKNFTALAVHQLAVQEKLSFSDPLKRFLPDYPNKQVAEKVTVQHLLDMTSGIGDIFNSRYESTPKEKLSTVSDFIPLFATDSLEFEPGTQRRYSNGGYVLLGAIIEKASGIDYYTYVRDNIFNPAGMTETESYEKDKDIPNRALGYTRRGLNLENNYSTLPERGSSAGGGYSTAKDLLKYTVALQEGKIPSGIVSGMGIAGGASGLNAALECNPMSGYAIVVLSNFDPPSAENMARKIRSWLPR